MSATTEPIPPPFTFVLEYMGSAMVIKSVRPASYFIFDDQPPYGSTDRNVQTWLLASLDPSILGSEQTVVDGEGKEAEVLPQADMKVPRSKRKYRCRVCKADGHGKCTCKLVKPTAMAFNVTTTFLLCRRWDRSKFGSTRVTHARNESEARVTHGSYK
ncbi:hypothetical protein WN943_019047 [Citrus x changshan-huyou]